MLKKTEKKKERYCVLVHISSGDVDKHCLQIGQKYKPPVY